MGMRTAYRLDSACLTGAGLELLEPVRERERERENKREREGGRERKREIQ